MKDCIDPLLVLQKPFKFNTLYTPAKHHKTPSQKTFAKPCIAHHKESPKLLLETYSTLWPFAQILGKLCITPPKTYEDPL